MPFFKKTLEQHQLYFIPERANGLCLCQQISDIFVTALNQGLIQFELKADIRIIVYMTQQTLGKLFPFWYIR